MLHGISNLGVLTDHVEPENRSPCTLLLAGVGDDDHRKGAGLGNLPGRNNYSLDYNSMIQKKNNKNNDNICILNTCWLVPFLFKSTI